MKHLLLLISILLAGLDIHAETFEGRMEVITFQNIDKKVQRFSSGIGYNGAVIFDIIVKGQKAIAHNRSLLYTTLFDPSKGYVYIWCELMGKGIYVDINDYIVAFACYTNQPRSFLGNELPHYKYDLETKSNNLEAFGKRAELITGRIECSSTGGDVRCIFIPQTKLSKGLSTLFCHGFNSGGLPIKLECTLDMRVPLLGRFKGYESIEVQAIYWDYKPVEDDFKLPENIVFEKKGVHRIHGFYKKIGKFLRKNKLFPNQTGTEIEYELNEDDWNY